MEYLTNYDEKMKNAYAQLAAKMTMFKKRLLLLYLSIVLVCWAPGLTHGKGTNLPTSGIYGNTFLGFDGTQKLLLDILMVAVMEHKPNVCYLLFTGLAGNLVRC